MAHDPDAGIRTKELQHQFLIECHAYARESLIFRVKQREQLMRLHLLAQGTLLALALGVGVGDFTPPADASTDMIRFPIVLILAAPCALIFGLLYITEDYLVDFSSKHIAQFPKQESDLMGTGIEIMNLDVGMKGHLAKRSIPIRFTAQLFAFILVPLILSILCYYADPLAKWRPYAKSYLVVFDSVLLLSLFGFLIRLFLFRQKEAENSAEESTQPKSANARGKGGK
jgi:hypothetical protein